MPQIIWLVRHGNRLDFVNPEWFNTAIRRYDPPLSDDGILQAELLADQLQSETIDHLFASTFLRTIQTAYPIAQKLNLSIKLESGLGEWHNPEWMSEKPETQPFNELISLYPLIDSEYRSQIIPQYPETINDVEQRTQKTIEKLLQKFPGNILIIGHAVSITGIAYSLIGKEQKIQTNLCSVNKIIKDGQKWMRN
jgi:broad specificity phosphatase PhoE